MKRRRPKLGQHFLVSDGVCGRIARAIPVAAGDWVIEIGPGRGALTRKLAAHGARLAAIEIDHDLADALRREFAGNPRIEIVEGDILEADIGAICRRANAASCAVFGNLPYYITSPVLRRLFAARNVISRMALLMQKEPALRVAAAPGSRDYGFLSVLAQYSSTPKLAFGVPPGAFAPPPKVDSALVCFEMKARTLENEGEAAFLDFARACFAQKRKSVANNLEGLWPRPAALRALASMSLDVRVRAEAMSLAELEALFKLLNRM